MIQYVKYIDENTIEEAPVNYKNISNFNLDIDLMVENGFYPLIFINNSSNIEFPKIRYKVDEGTVIGEYYNDEPSLEDCKEKWSNELCNYIDNLNNNLRIHIHDKVFNKNLYDITYLQALISSEENSSFYDINDNSIELTTEDIRKYLKDKVFIENKIKKYKEEKLSEINKCESKEELKKVHIYDSMINYFNINEVHSNIREETLLNEATGFESDAINICAYFSDETRVYYGGLGIVNKEYLEERNIPYIHLSYASGTIVGLNGDLNLSINCTKNLTDEMEETVVEVLREKGLNVSIENNDVLIDGKKCCGCAGFFHMKPQDRFLKMYIHMSFNLDRELIEKVRVKEQKKDLIAINEVLPDFTREEFLRLWKEKLNAKGYRSI